MLAVHSLTIWRQTLHTRSARRISGYRILFVEPSRLSEALQVLCGRPSPLPFVREPVATNATLSHAVQAAFQAPLDAWAVESLRLELAAARGVGGR
jgi:hypothetical protein